MLQLPTACRKAGSHVTFEETSPYEHRVAHRFTNPAQAAASTMQSRLGGLLGAMARQRQAAGTLPPAIAQCLKVTRSSWPGRFHDDEVADRPRTTNALEQSCGVPRYHERWTTGRQTATAALGGRGAVRLVACAATRLGAVSPEARVPHDLNAWKTRRRDLAARHRSRTLQRRFRRDSTASLARLESQLLQLSLPP